MRDGLYQCTTKYLCAGFLVQDGRVVMCAPILRGQIRNWYGRPACRWIGP